MPWCFIIKTEIVVRCADRLDTAVKSDEVQLRRGTLAVALPIALLIHGQQRIDRKRVFDVREH